MSTSLKISLPPMEYHQVRRRCHPIQADFHRRLDLQTRLQEETASWSSGLTSTSATKRRPSLAAFASLHSRAVVGLGEGPKCSHGARKRNPLPVTKGPLTLVWMSERPWRLNTCGDRLFVHKALQACRKRILIK